MGAQDFGYAAAVEAGLLFEPLKEACHAFRIEAGFGHRADADAVGLHFVGAGEVHLVLVAQGAAGAERTDDQIAIAGGGAGDDAGQHRRHRRHVADLGAFDRARDMALGDVRHFVAHHAGDLAFVA